MSLRGVGCGFQASHRVLAPLRPRGECEHGSGNIELSPAGAARLFKWMEPEIPAGWHAVTDAPKGEGVPIVNVRK